MQYININIATNKYPASKDYHLTNTIILFHLSINIWQSLLYGYSLHSKFWGHWMKHSSFSCSCELTRKLRRKNLQVTENVMVWRKVDKSLYKGRLECRHVASLGRDQRKRQGDSQGDNTSTSSIKVIYSLDESQWFHVYELGVESRFLGLTPRVSNSANLENSLGFNNFNMHLRWFRHMWLWVGKDNQKGNVKSLKEVQKAFFKGADYGL